MRLGGRLGAMQSAAARCTRPDGASLAGLWVVAVFGGNAGGRARGVSEAVRDPSVKTSGDDGLTWGQGRSLAFAGAAAVSDLGRRTCGASRCRLDQGGWL